MVIARRLIDQGARTSPDSKPRQALNLGLQKGTVLLSYATLAELYDVLSRKRFQRHIDEDDIQTFVAVLTREAEWVDVDVRIAACRDARLADRAVRCDKICSMKISREEVVRVAELAYLELSETELETYRAQIDEILEYIGKLNELDTAKVEPMAQVLTDEQTADATLREDVVVDCGIAAEVLKQAPDPEPPFFRVPKVIER